MNVCVFCGSSIGLNAIYTEAARELGRALSQSGHNLVYGGGNVGLMGILADSVLEFSGEVIGVIPDFLVQREVAHRGITRLEVVDNMHTRKKRMADLADAFIAMPGGWGTLDELAEILTWKQLGLIHQPIGLLNTNNFFDSLISQMNLMVTDGFLRFDNLSALSISSVPTTLLNQLTQQLSGTNRQ
jgi:uncharacterized protein (TIGR00730 family)